jgi:HAD superfamily hydrolase (TIGR01450 family)
MDRYLREKGIPFALLTNECRYTNRQLADKLNCLLELSGAKVSLKPEQIYSAACSAGDFFERLLRHRFTGSVYCIGEDGLCTALRKAYSSHSPSPSIAAAQTDTQETRSRVPTVLCGEEEYDEESMTPVEFVCVGSVHADNTRDIERAAEYVRKNEARVVYTCPDYYDVYADGRLAFGMPMPVVDLLERVLGCASYGLGKPNPHMVRMAADILLKQHDLTWTDVLFVGDSLNTDIRSAVENGISSALVLSGTTSLQKMAKSAIRPDFVFDSVHELHLAMMQGDL